MGLKLYALILASSEIDLIQDMIEHGQGISLNKTNRKSLKRLQQEIDSINMGLDGAVVTETDTRNDKIYKCLEKIVNKKLE